MAKGDDSVCFGEVLLLEVSGRYEVPGFAERYSVYQEKALQKDMPGKRAMQILSIVMMAVGGIIALVGGVTIVVGPSTVLVPYSGPDFFQFIQLYPGPIFSVGALLCFIGSHVSSSAEVSCTTAELYLLVGWRLIMPDGRECDEDLTLGYLGGDLFSISYEPGSAAVRTKNASG